MAAVAGGYWRTGGLEGGHGFIPSRLPAALFPTSPLLTANLGSLGQDDEDTCRPPHPTVLRSGPPDVTLGPSLGRGHFKCELRG